MKKKVTHIETHPRGGGRLKDMEGRVRPRIFDQVGHEIMYASSGNKHFFTKPCHRQTYLPKL